MPTKCEACRAIRDWRHDDSQIPPAANFAANFSRSRVGLRIPGLNRNCISNVFAANSLLLGGGNFSQRGREFSLGEKGIFRRRKELPCARTGRSTRWAARGAGGRGGDRRRHRSWPWCFLG